MLRENEKTKTKKHRCSTIMEQTLSNMETREAFSISIWSSSIEINRDGRIEQENENQTLIYEW